MTVYSAYLTDAAGHFIGVELIHSETDTEAMDAASKRLRRSAVAAIEVWQMTRCVGKVEREQTGQHGKDRLIS